MVPIQNGVSYPERRPVDWRPHRRATHTTTSILNTSPAHEQPIPMGTARSQSAASGSPTHRLTEMQGRKRSSAHTRHGTPHSSSAPSTRHATKRRTPQTRRRPGPLPRALASRAPRTAASGPHHPREHNAHTKRARTNRSGRATYSAQALGRLPWFAPCLRRSRRLRPRFDMSFSLGLLSRLKHFCTHWPKPPRHRPFAATKVTEKRAAAQASSAHVTPRGRALSQRA